MTTTSRKRARALFFAVIAVEWVWVVATAAKEERSRVLGVMVFAGTFAALCELLLRRTALDQNARDLVSFVLFGAMLGLLPAVVGQ